MTSRLTRTSFNTHVVDISFSLGDEKNEWKEPIIPQTSSRRNSCEQSHQSQESMSYDSLLSFALKMNTSQVATSALKDHDIECHYLENSSFLTNVVNKESLRRGLSEQQIMIRVIEEVERARQRLLRRVCSTPNTSGEPLHDAMQEPESNHDKDDDDDDDDNYSSDSIGSYVNADDDDAASGFGIGEGMMDSEVDENWEGLTPRRGGGGTIRSCLGDGRSTDEVTMAVDFLEKDEVFDVFSRLLEEGEGESSEEGGTSPRSRSYAEASRSQGMDSWRERDLHLHELLAGVYRRSPSRLPRVTPSQSKETGGEQAVYMERPSMLYTDADPFTAGDKGMIW